MNRQAGSLSKPTEAQEVTSLSDLRIDIRGLRDPEIITMNLKSVEKWSK